MSNNLLPNSGGLMAEQVLNESPNVLPTTNPTSTPQKAQQPGTVPGNPGTGTSEGQAAEGNNASAKLHALIRRERAAIAREQSAKTIEAQIQARQEAVSAKEAKFAELENLKNTNPRKALELLGLSYQQLTDIELNDGNVTPEIQVKKLEEKLEGWEKTQKAREEASAQAAREAASRAEVQATADFKQEIGAFLKENGKKYELTNFETQEDLVYEVINAHYERTLNPETGLGKIMSIADAADRVEKFLKGKYEKAKDLETVRSIWAPAPPVKPKTPEPTRHKPPTLTNTMSATPSRPRNVPRTDDERIQAAIAYAKGLRT